MIIDYRTPCTPMASNKSMHNESQHNFHPMVPPVIPNAIASNQGMYHPMPSAGEATIMSLIVHNMPSILSLRSVVLFYLCVSSRSFQWYNASCAADTTPILADAAATRNLSNDAHNAKLPPEFLAVAAFCAF